MTERMAYRPPGSPERAGRGKGRARRGRGRAGLGGGRAGRAGRGRGGDARDAWDARDAREDAGRTRGTRRTHVLGCHAAYSGMYLCMDDCVCVDGCMDVGM